MTLDIVLQLRDEAGLKSFLEELYDPNSGIYHQFLTPAQFTERFGPSEQEYAAVVGSRRQTAWRSSADRGMAWKCR